MERKTCTFRIRKDVHQAVKAKALDDDISFEAALEKALIASMPTVVRQRLRAAIRDDAKAGK